MRAVLKRLDGCEVRRSAERALEANRTAAAETSSFIAWRSSSCCRPRGDGRDRLPPPNRLSVEGAASPVQLGIDVPCAVPGLVRGRRLHSDLRGDASVLRQAAW